MAIQFSRYILLHIRGGEIQSSQLKNLIPKDRELQGFFATCLSLIIHTSTVLPPPDPFSSFILSPISGTLTFQLCLELNSPLQLIILKWSSTLVPRRFVLLLELPSFSHASLFLISPIIWAPQTDTAHLISILFPEPQAMWTFAHMINWHWRSSRSKSMRTDYPGLQPSKNCFVVGQAFRI